tara:strand:- start:643 stop:1137 length:495 start_codon:yes stop_codon:yes gene_type:complete
MAILLKTFRLKILDLIPLILLFYISLNGNSVIHVKFFSINVHYILIYFWVLRQPAALGYGFIFLSGIISDVIYGTPLGSTALALLVVSSVAIYVRAVTVRINLINDWISFIPALLFANFIYYVALYFSNYPIDYLYLFTNSIFTFIFYPLLWSIFSILLKFMKE